MPETGTVADRVESPTTNGEPRLISMRVGRYRSRVRALLNARGDVAQFWQRVAGTFVSRGLVVVLGLATAILTSRVLGPEGRGAFAVMITVGMVGIQLGNLGLPTANAYFVASRPRRLPALIGGSLAVGLGLGSVIGIAYYALARAIPQIAPLSSGTLLAWAAAWIPLGLTLSLFQNLLLGLKNIRLYNTLQAAQKALTVALLVGITLMGAAGVLPFYLASLAVLALSVTFVTAHLLRRTGGRAVLPAIVLWRRMAGYGFRAYLAMLFSYLVLNFDLLMVAGMLGEADAGFYSIAVRMSEMMYMFPVALGSILFTTVASMKEDPWAFTRKVTIRLALLMAPVLIVTGMFASPVIRLLFGEEFLPAVPALLWLLPGIFVLSINTVFMHFFAGIGMPLVAVISPAIAAGVNIALNLYMLPLWGIAGAAVASTISYSLMLVASLIYLKFRAAPVAP